MLTPFTQKVSEHNERPPSKLERCEALTPASFACGRVCVAWTDGYSNPGKSILAAFIINCCSIPSVGQHESRRREIALRRFSHD